METINQQDVFTTEDIDNEAVSATNSEAETVANEVDTEQAAQFAQESLENILRLMAADVEIELEEREGKPLLSLFGADEGMIIGRHGETLQAIQVVINTMLQHKYRNGIRPEIVVDVDDYLMRRQNNLINMAESWADRVSNKGRSYHTKPMNARDRRIVHMALRDHPQVQTKSVGTHEKRHVLILPKNID